MILHTLPCGCRIEKDAKSVGHIYPCKWDCPSPQLLVQVFQRNNVPVVDCRPAEAVMGRHINEKEADEIINAVMPPERN